MSKLADKTIQAVIALFGVRITVLYANGTKMCMRARQFDVSISPSRCEMKWRRPLLSWSREPLWLNVDEVVAVWQGRA